MEEQYLGDPGRLRTETAWLQKLAGRLVSAADAEDVAQDSWLARLRSRTAPANPAAWLSTVARNFARRTLRDDTRRTQRHHGTRDISPSTAPSPEELLSRLEAQRVLIELVTGLDEPYRSTVLFTYAEDLSPTEIAKRIGVPAGTVRWRLKTAMDQLRRRADERFGGDRRVALRSLIPVSLIGQQGATKGGLHVTATAKLGLMVGAVALVGVGVAFLRTGSRSGGVVASARTLMAPAGDSSNAAAAAPRPGAPTPRFNVTSTAYDPLRSTERPMRLFQRETRDETWAVAMETYIREELSRDLRLGAPEAELTKVECRDLSCYYEATAADTQSTAAMAALQYVFYGRRCFPQGAVRADGGNATFAVVCLNGPDDKDIDGLKRVMVLQRANVRKAKGTIQESVAEWIRKVGPSMPRPMKR
jgi:RNA polymerase sigma-70 factor, ECF subfamily